MRPRIEIDVETPARKIAGIFRRQARAVPEATWAGMADVGRLLHREAKRLSGREWVSRSYVDKWHPYSRRHPKPRPPDWKINVRTGKYHRSWRWSRFRIGRDMTVTLWNQADYARYLTMRGTKLMVPRPIIQHVVTTKRKEMLNILRRRLRRATR